MAYLRCEQNYFVYYENWNQEGVLISWLSRSKCENPHLRSLAQSSGNIPLSPVSHSDFPLKVSLVENNSIVLHSFLPLPSREGICAFIPRPFYPHFLLPKLVRMNLSEMFSHHFWACTQVNFWGVLPLLLACSIVPGVWTCFIASFHKQMQFFLSYY